MNILEGDNVTVKGMEEFEEAPSGSAREQY